MLEIEYTTSTPETATASLDFMTNRPLLATMFVGMKYTCIALCIIFAMAWYKHAVRPQDFVTFATAIIWLSFYKPINRWVIKRILKNRKFADMKCVVRIDDKSIFYQVHKFLPQHIEWKKLKFVLKNKDGYIIPLTGITNAGRYIWLPLRSFQDPNQEQQFLEFVNKYKLKMKTAS